MKTNKLRKRLINSAKTNSKRVHITPRPKGWAIRKEGTLKAYRVKDTQKEVVALANKWVKSGSATTVIIHGKNGKFRSSK